MTATLRDRRRRGWFHIDNAVLDEYGERLGAIGLAVYMCLARHADKESVAFPSYNRIARDLHISRSAAIRAIADLDACGLIATETVKQEGKRPFNRYTLVSVVHQSNGVTEQLVSESDAIGVTDEDRLVSQGHPNKTQLEQDPENKTQSAPAREETHIPFFMSAPQLTFARVNGWTVKQAHDLARAIVGEGVPAADVEREWRRRITAHCRDPPHAAD